jgi:hypothetical protein
MSYTILNSYLTVAQLEHLSKILSDSRLQQIENFCSTVDVINIEPYSLTCANTFELLSAGVTIHTREPESSEVSYSFREQSCHIRKVAQDQQSTVMIDIDNRTRIRSVGNRMSVNALNTQDITDYFVNPQVDVQKAQYRLVLQ